MYNKNKRDNEYKKIRFASSKQVSKAAKWALKRFSEMFKILSLND